MKHISLSRFVGTLLAILGGLVMLGWYLRLEPLVRVLPRSAPIVFNTALSFALAGGALLVPVSDPVRYRRLTTTFGSALVIIAVLVVAEHLLQWSLDVDWPSLHAWM